MKTLGRCPGWSESLLSAHSFCWFCHVGAQLLLLVSVAEQAGCTLRSQVFSWHSSNINTFKPPYDKTNKVACAPSEDSDQPGRPPSLIRVFAVRMKKAWVLSYPLSTQRRIWSDWADAQADLSLRWAHMSLCWFYHEVAHLFDWKSLTVICIHRIYHAFSFPRSLDSLGLTR